MTQVPASNRGGGSSTTGLVLIEEKLLVAPAASMDFTGIPATYKHLRLIGMLRGDQSAAAVNVRVRFNGDSGANYDSERITAAAAAVGASEELGQTSMQLGTVPAATALAGAAGLIDIFIPGYAKTVFSKTALVTNFRRSAAGTGGMNEIVDAGQWRTTSAVTQITITMSAGNVDTSSEASLFGIA